MNPSARFTFFLAHALFLVSTCLAVDVPQDMATPRFPKELFPKKDERLTEADELFDAGLYPQAIAIYQTILESIPEQIEKADDLFLTQLDMQTRFHLAQALYATEKYDGAITFLAKNTAISTPLSLPLEEIRYNSIYLTALSYKAMGRYIEAINTLQRYLNEKKQPTLTFYEEAQFEMGQIYFLGDRHQEAKRQFEALDSPTTKQRLRTLSQLYLGRISLTQGQYKEAATILANSASQLSPNDVLRFELYYLQGEACFQLHDYSKAMKFFEEALPYPQPEKCSWYVETLYHLGWSYLKIGDDPFKSKNDQENYFTKAEEAFKKLLANAPEERLHLALGQCYLSRANRLQEKNAYAQAEAVLSHQEAFSSREGQSHALLLRAAAAPSYVLRDKFYRQLTQDVNRGNSFYAKGWYMRGMNDFDHGHALLQEGRQEEGRNAFERSAVSFRKAFDLLKNDEKSQAGSALKYQALAISYSGHLQSEQQAFNLLEELMSEYPDQWKAMDDPDEILYLHGFFAARLGDKADKEKFLAIADQSLKSAALLNGKFGDVSLLQLGAMHFRHNNYAVAEGIYLDLANRFPASLLCGEAWFWAACCSDYLQQDTKIGKQRRRYAFENFPQSPYAAEAYFTLYSYQDYLQGDRTAIKHLQSFSEKYPDTLFLMEAYYLIGLDYKRDRKTEEGKWIRKKSLTETIDAFQEVETHFDAFMEKGNIPPDRLEYYIAIRYRATLERALANLAIAEESQGAKRQIYFEYAEEVFQNLVKDFQSDEHPYTQRLFQSDAFPSIYEESAFWLAQTYIKLHDDEKAERVLSEMLERYRLVKITRGYYLSRVWYEQGKIAMNRKEYSLALQFFKQAEDAAKGNVLGTDQKLDLWIQQSLCYRGLNQYDHAILILSRVVNDDAVSSLRLKAMFLRAETYELQGRPELARKQLESMAKKGGSWALKAHEKLEKDYGY